MWQKIIHVSLGTHQFLAKVWKQRIVTRNIYWFWEDTLGIKRKLSDSVIWSISATKQLRKSLLVLHPRLPLIWNHKKCSKHLSYIMFWEHDLMFGLKSLNDLIAYSHHFPNLLFRWCLIMTADICKTILNITEAHYRTNCLKCSLRQTGERKWIPQSYVGMAVLGVIPQLVSGQHGPKLPILWYTYSIRESAMIAKSNFLHFHAYQIHANLP